MSEHVKSNEEIRAHPDELRETLARARAQFGRIEGVVSVGIGQKNTGGSYRDDLAIVVVLRRKSPLEQLAPEERIPTVFEGYRTDVVVMKDAAALLCQNDTKYEVIRGGIQIAPQIKRSAGGGTGTLGCIVRRRGDVGRENVYLLTCHHVLFHQGSGAGDYAYHPYAPPFSGQQAQGPSKPLGPIQPDARRENIGFRVPGSPDITQHFIDCATARIDLGSNCFGCTCPTSATTFEATILDLGLPGANVAISDVRNVIDDATIVMRRVFKVGKTTGKTTGIVRLISASPNVPRDPDDASSPGMPAASMIQIDFDTSSTANGLNCLGNPRFAEPGDSGSIVVDEEMKAIGLLTLGPPDGTSLNESYACHILPVLNALRICIVTEGGTSRGSCAALDGSGTALVFPSQAERPDEHGEFRFTARSSGPPVEVQAVSEQERAQMLALADALRASPRGCALHDAFADVRGEIGYLVRNERPVKVAWHRHRGPAFLAHVLNHLKGDSPAVPRAINGVTMDALLERMCAVLSAQGSQTLRAAIEQHGALLQEVVAGGDTVQDWLAALRALESAEVAS